MGADCILGKVSGNHAQLNTKSQGALSAPQGMLLAHADGVEVICSQPSHISSWRGSVAAVGPEQLSQLPKCWYKVLAAYLQLPLKIDCHGLQLEYVIGVPVQEEHLSPA